MKEFFTRLFKRPATVKKFIVAFVGAVVTAVSMGLLPETVGKWATVVVAFLTALGVYGISNEGDGIPPGDEL